MVNHNLHENEVYIHTLVLPGICAVVGGVTAVVAAPVVVSAIGFGAGGIIAGSWAASMMSTLGAGGLVATLQSVGAAGLGVTGSAVLSTIGAGVGTGVGTVVKRLR